MTPILFSSAETDFTSNGIGRLRDCISCEVTEERNGAYELEFEYPVNGIHFSDLAPGMIVGAIHDDDHDIQPFVIYAVEASLESVRFYARHLSYRLTDILLSPFTASGVTAALNGISSNSVNTNPFSFTTDKIGGGDFTVSKPQSVRSALMGEEGSCLDVFGGEFEFDKWDVIFHSSRGSDTGVTVRYGKNMLGLEQEIDGGETFTAVAPYFPDGDTFIYLPEYYVQPTTPPALPLTIRAMDFSEYFSTAPTEAELRSTAKAWIDRTKPWIPSENIKVDFVALWQTEQYKDVAEIQRVRLCDTVSVYYTALGIVAEKRKVVRTVYDVLKERLTEIELGDLSEQFVAITGEDTTGRDSGFMTELVSGTGASRNAGGNYSGSFTVSRTGYRAIAIAGFTSNASSGAVIRMDLDVSEQTVYFNIRNVGSTSATLTPACRVVYIKI